MDVRVLSNINVKRWVYYGCMRHSYVINSLWPSDVICRHKFESTLVHVMACYPTSPSHYLNQC